MHLADLDVPVHHPLPQNFHGFVGATPQTFEIFNETRLAASTPWPVLLLGETGTGKELLARAIHDYSERRTGPFVAVNCGALTPQLAASELFGHEKGAFTGADVRREGAFAQANGGTLFLDEVGDLPQETQAALLRVLETGQFRPLGVDRARAVSVRLVAATHRHLEDESAFRSDLFHRLDGWTIRVPPLRARPGDVVAIAEAMLRELAPGCAFDPSARAALTEHPWPGNVRQLRNTIRRASRRRRSKLITVDDLRLEQRLTAQQASRRVLRRALEKHWGNLRATAAALGISDRTLRRRLEGVGLELATERRRGRLLRYRRDLQLVIEEGSPSRAAAALDESAQAFSYRYHNQERRLQALIKDAKDLAHVAAAVGLEVHELEDLLQARAIARKVAGHASR